MCQLQGGYCSVGFGPEHLINLKKATKQAQIDKSLKEGTCSSSDPNKSSKMLELKCSAVQCPCLKDATASFHGLVIAIITCTMQIT